MILGITGLAQSGKDTCASYLIDAYGFQRKAFADKVKEFSYLINSELREAVDAVGWEATKKIPTYRRFLQDVGHNARLTFDSNFWVDQALGYHDSTLYDGNNKFVVSDARYSNEFDRVWWLGGKMVRVTRPGLGMVNNHVTETQHLLIPVDYEVINDGSLEKLYRQLDKIMEELSIDGIV